MNDIMNKSMIVYKITNTVNGMSYVGMTAQTLGKRIEQHAQADSVIGSAIRKYGIENFTIDVIDEGNTIEELCERERYWIATLNTKAPNGYNKTNGGEGIAGRKHSDKARANMAAAHRGKPCTQQALDNLLAGRLKLARAVMCVETGEVYETIAEAARCNSLAASSISNVCLGKLTTAGGRHWRYIENPIAPKIPQKRGGFNKRAVRCVETGEVFESISAAAKHYNISPRRIACACKDIAYTAAKKHWQWADEQPIVMNDNVKLSTPGSGRAVRCVETGIIYPSMSEAARSTGVSTSTLASVCYGISKTIKGLHFHFYDPDGVNPTIEDVMNDKPAGFVAVICVETGIEYPTLRDAAKAVGLSDSAIRLASRNKNKTAGGFHWRRLDNQPKSCKRTVRCLETNIVYQSMAEAARDNNVNEKSVNLVCHGKLKAVKGLHFEYVD